MIWVLGAAPAMAGAVQGASIDELRSLLEGNDAAGLYDFLNRPNFRGQIDSTPEVEGIAVSVIRKAASDPGGGSTRRRFFYSLRSYRSPEIFRYLIATYKSDLSNVRLQSRGLPYSIFREDEENVLHGDSASMPDFVRGLTDLLPLFPDLCAGRKVVDFLMSQPAAFASIRDLYLRLSLEPSQTCGDSGSSLTHALAGLHTAAASEAVVQRLHLWVDRRPPSMLRDNEIKDAISVLGAQPPEAQVDLDAIEREIANAPLFFEGNRSQIKTLIARQREFADRSKHFLLQNLTDEIERGNLVSVESLLENGADPNWVSIPWGSQNSAAHSPGVTMLSLAVRGGRLDMAQLLVKNGADVNRADSNAEALRPLHHACDSRGNRHAPSLSLASFLLANGALADARDVAGDSALHFAVWSDSDASADVVALLIAHGVSIVGRDFAGYSASDYAAKFGSVRILEVLIAAGAPIEGRLSPPTDRDGKPAYNPIPWGVGATPLILAAASGKIKTVMSLLRRKADINAATETGVTALRIAVADGDPEIVGLLLDTGANLRAIAPQAPAPLNLPLVLLAQEQHENHKATNPIGHLYVLDILAAHGLHSDPVTAAKYALEETYLKCCYVPLSH